MYGGIVVVVGTIVVVVGAIVVVVGAIVVVVGAIVVVVGAIVVAIVVVVVGAIVVVVVGAIVVVVVGAIVVVVGAIVVVVGAIVVVVGAIVVVVGAIVVVVGAIVVVVGAIVVVVVGGGVTEPTAHTKPLGTSAGLAVMVIGAVQYLSSTLPVAVSCVQAKPIEYAPFGTRAAVKPVKPKLNVPMLGIAPVVSAGFASTNGLPLENNGSRTVAPVLCGDGPLKSNTIVSTLTDDDTRKVWMR